MNRFCQLLPVTLYLTLLTSTTFCQELRNDTALIEAAQNQVNARYIESAGEALQIYKGVEYLRISKKTNGSAFFGSDEPITGSLRYDGFNYNNISLRYDLVNDKLVVQDLSKGMNISLLPEKVQSFTLSGHLFLYIGRGESSNGALNPGFYDLLSGGTIQLYAKRKKYFELPAKADDETLPKFTEVNTYYILKDNYFHEVGNEKSVLNELGDKKDQLKKFIRSEHIRFNKHQEESLFQITQYYNQLFN
jgi:hypothetical protein